MSEILEYFQENLSGSGFNCEWSEEAVAEGYCLKTAFHVMGESGMYEGYAAFNLEIDRKAITFNISPADTDSDKLIQEYGLMEYLEDEVDETLKNFRERNNN